MATRWKLLLSIFLLVLAIDQTTKFWAVANLTRAFEMEQARTPAAKVRTFLGAEKRERIRQRPVVLQRDHVRLRYVENPGAAWGMFGGMEKRHRVPFFTVITLASLAFMFAFFRRLPENQRLLQVALSLVLGGAVGNFVDRLLRGYVIDFIDVHWKNDPRLHWPTFNVADIAICVGVALLLSKTFFGRQLAAAAPLQEQEPIPDHPPAPAFIELDEGEAPAAPRTEPFAPRAVAADGTLLDTPEPLEATEDPPGNRAAEGAGSPAIPQKE